MASFFHHRPLSWRRRGTLIGVALVIEFARIAAAAATERPGDAEGARTETIDIAVALAASEEEDEAATVDAAEYQEAPQEATDEPSADQVSAEPEMALAAPTEEVKPAEEPDPRRRYRPITEIVADARLPEGLLPEQVGREERKAAASPAIPEIGDARLDAGWAENYYQWSATKLCHGPLYFEEINLERYGYQCHPAVQPLVSGAHFFLTVPTLPYQMTAHPPRECIYTLGYYRPGSRVPWQRSRLPWDPRAAAVEAGVAVGLVFLIP